MSRMRAMSFQVAVGRYFSAAATSAETVRTAAATFFAVLTLCACAGGGRDKAERFAYVERPVEQLYNEAMDMLDKKRWSDAVALFDEVERQHPYSSWARRAMLMSAFASYQSNDYEDAIQGSDRFIALHPGNADAPYAYYLKGMAYYEQIRDVGRDQDITENALTALNDVVRRYPESEYARDARLKIDLTRDHLAGKEMYVGRYYLRRNQHIAAINRFKRVITEYQTTTHTPEALHRLVESYIEIGVPEEAEQIAAVLGYNYPGSKWYEESYALLTSRGLAPAEKTDKSWLSRLTSVF
ncbi:MAG: outer membrane protein assembly factor BamD [Pseudomonadota bacterium]